MMTALEPPALGWGSLAAILAAMFAISVGYGVVLPILPFLIERLAGPLEPARLASHTGLLTGTYILAIFVFAPLWGALSDRWGRKPVILLGLAGFAATVALLAIAQSLTMLYVGRLLSGLFAAAVTPAAYALIGDHAPSKEWRAHRFALINIAGTAGFFIGPLLGGLAVRLSGGMFGVAPDEAFSTPFLAATGLAAAAALLVFLVVPGQVKRDVENGPAEANQVERSAALRLLAIAFVTALAIGSFEVGLSLQGKSLGLDAAHIGAMFAECSLVMAVVQAVIFSPLIKPELTRWFIAPGLAILSVGLIVVPLASASLTMTVAVALVAASAGMLSPVATYWASLSMGASQGATLGRMTASASLGQAIGSAVGGLLFDVPFLPAAGFFLAALVVFATFLISFPLPHHLVPRGEEVK
ncbi:MAG: MFS transporter [Pseudomonadota bacterium]